MRSLSTLLHRALLRTTRASSIALLLALTALLAPQAAAQDVSPEVAEEVTLDEAITYVREQSPAARALRGQVAVADADIDLAGVYPNPELSYVGMGRFDGGNAAINGSQHQVWLDIPLLIAGQNGARREVAEANAETSRAEVEVVLLALEIEVRRAFVALLAAQERVARLELARTDLERVHALIEARGRAGAQSRYDEARLSVERARMESELSRARIEMESARTALASLAGRPGWRPTARGALRTEDTPGGEQTAAAVRAARARLVAAERDVHRAEVERIPEITLGAGAYFTTDLDSSSAYLGLTIPLPVIDTGEASERRARAARDAAADASDATERETSARLAGALSERALQRQALDEFERGAMAQLPMLIEMAESAYRLGESSLFELLDALRTRAELELTRVDLLRASAEADINVRAAGGLRE